MRYIVAVLFATLTTAMPVLATHYDFDTTDANHSILIRDVYLTAGHWGAGDEIAVFTPVGLCAGAGVVDSLPLGIAAMGDDALTDSIDGFRDGEVIGFRRWDAAAEQEFTLPQVFVLEGEAVWRANGLLIAELADREPHFAVHPTYPRHRIECRVAEFFMGEAQIGPRSFDEVALLTPTGAIGGLLFWPFDGDSIFADSAVGWAYGDDTTTAEIVEGFRPGEPFLYRYWSRHADYTIDVPNWVILLGDTVFTDSGQSVVRLWNEPVSVAGEPALPAQFRLLGAYPNPFNGRTVVAFEQPRSGPVTLVLFSADGRQVANAGVRGGKFGAGRQQIPLDLSLFPAGNYMCEIRAQDGRAVLPLLLVK